MPDRIVVGLWRRRRILDDIVTIRVCSFCKLLLPSRMSLASPIARGWHLVLSLSTCSFGENTLTHVTVSLSKNCMLLYHKISRIIFFLLLVHGYCQLHYCLLNRCITTHSTVVNCGCSVDISSTNSQQFRIVRFGSGELVSFCDTHRECGTLL